jgi:hypothetical protein
MTQLAKDEVWKADNANVTDAQDLIDDSGHVVNCL